MSRNYVRGLRRAASCIRAGGVVAYPTEAVFGLGCDPRDDQAVARVIDLKRRASDKGMIVIAAEPRQLEGLVAGTCWQQFVDSAGEVSDGRATTFVMPAGAHASPLLCGARTTIAVRVCRHPLAQALCRYSDGPVVSTSANLSGRQPAHTAIQARRWFLHDVDVVLGGRVGTDPRPSRIIDLVSGEVLRA